MTRRISAKPIRVNPFPSQRGIPTVQDNFPSVQQTAEALQETTELLARQRGNDAESAARLGELADTESRLDRAKAERRHEHDIVDIVELADRLDAIEDRLTAIEELQETMQTTLDDHQTILDDHETRITALEP